MRRKMDIELKAGAFIFFGLVLTMITILLMGGGKSLFESNYTLFVTLPDANGLAKGAAIRSGGLLVGRVGDISFTENYDAVKVSMTISEEFKARIRQDSLVRLQTQGVLGDKFLEITAGSSAAAIADAGSMIPAEPSKDLSAMLADGTSAVQLLKETLANLKVITGGIAKGNQVEGLMKDLSETTSNLKAFSMQMKNGNAMAELNHTMKNLRSVSEKMKNGEGTIGALFNDASLYEDLKNLIGGANRNNVLKFFVRQAVKSNDEAQVANQEEGKKGKNPASAPTPEKK